MVHLVLVEQVDRMVLYSVHLVLLELQVQVEVLERLV